MDPILGSLQLFPFEFVPRGWHACDGTLLPISQNQSLYSLLGTRFGGDGQTTFGLPDLEAPDDRTTYCICLVGAYPSRG